MNFGRRFSETPQVVLNLIILNTLIFFAQASFGGLSDDSHINDLFALHHYRSDVFRPYQLITHMFLHGSFMHLFFNMFGLWMFGSVMERIWSPKKFITFYLLCGIVAGLTQMANYAYDFWQIDHPPFNLKTLVNNPRYFFEHFHNVLNVSDFIQYQKAMRMNATVGASGAIMGVLVAYGFLFPDTEMIIFPIPIPIKAKWAIIGIVALDFFGGISDTANDNVAHFAHIGGAIAGYLIMRYWKNKGSQYHY